MLKLDVENINMQNEDLHEELITTLMEMGNYIFNQGNQLEVFTQLDEEWRLMCEALDVEEYSNALAHFYEYELAMQKIYEVANSSPSINEN